MKKFEEMEKLHTYNGIVLQGMNVKWISTNILLPAILVLPMVNI
jgi:hypothetical protein